MTPRTRSAAAGPSATAPRAQPTRIGAARPSHLLTTAGVGAIVDLPSMSVVVRGLDAWETVGEVIHEPRLLSNVQSALPMVRKLTAMPWNPDDADDPWSRLGVPVTPFPRWLRCPACARFGPIDGTQQFALVHRNPHRPDRAKWVHTTCTKQPPNRRDANRRACIPARFLVVCPDGHLDEFPYEEFVHGPGDRCPAPTYRMTDSASTLGPRVAISCDECKAQANLQAAAGTEGRQKLPKCRGRHPHLQRYEPCGNQLQLIVLGASNMWFPVTVSALHLPTGASLAELVAEHAALLTGQPTPELAQMVIDLAPALAPLRAFPIEDVWKAICVLRDAPAAGQESSGDLLDAEWALLSRPTTEKQDADFKAEPVASPGGYESLIDQVVQVSRLREVRALVGFTRLHSPARQDPNPRGRIPLARTAPPWVPAAEQRGEGIFLELREPAVAAWEAKIVESERIERLRRAYGRWARNRDQDADPTFPIARYLLLHTLSHLLIRQVALECGYSAASVRERLYIGTRGNRTAGILLSTAASDSEGTLGGLVALGRPEYLKRLLDQAFYDAARCSSDPLCAEHDPGVGDDLHNAACHACLFASETSCERGNRWLDRAVLVDLPGTDIAFPLG